jgi:hypothetical protein
MTKTRAVIRRSRKKIVRMVWLAAGVWVLVVVAWYFLRQVAIGPLITIGLPILAVLLFLALVRGVVQLFDARPGLVLDHASLLDRASGLGEVRVRWADVTGISETQVQLTRVVLVHVADPRVVLDQMQGLRRKMGESLLKQYGAPLMLSANALEIDHERLLALLREHWAVYQAK